ncbi:hypothetical protein NLJ89_g9401 [Agrocybe chaxingu]|uniref:RNA helicase n=1 Tax=Agrocybe chaxingu TaxID=84603 RepID=A0A9W8JTM2_9AGAR|nr:hypothetical protein NLJ89_g9401 [Agrocybe chaxingu]
MSGMSQVFWKPGTVGPGSNLDRASETEESVIPSAPNDLYGQRERLPIFKHREKLLYCIEKFSVVVVVGQTGCGKTTHNGHVIACTQPRRIAATSVASRVASEVGTNLGDEVGYTIRFEDVSSKEKTRLLYMTDGMLFRETLVDPLLSRYSVIMVKPSSHPAFIAITNPRLLSRKVDEAHERSVYTDLLLGILRKICKKRPSLRIIVSSATLDATKFLDYFSQGTSQEEATIISLEGRMYPVEVAYLQEPAPDYIRKAAEVAWNINLQQGPGDILVFLTGREDIDRCLQELSDMIPTLPTRATRLIPLPLHAGLTTDEQLQNFQSASPGTRKVIISTNIAEASVTIDGVKFVVDCGFVKIRVFNPTTALASLATVPISVASATQRAGRAGRTSPGICYRLYPMSVFKTLPAVTSPEITRTDMTTPILQLKSLGVDDLMKFDWVSAPPAETVLRALEGLHAAGMIDEHGRLTPIGEQVSECPVEVGIARMSKEYKCGEEILTIAAMTTVQDAFVIPDGAAGALAELERRKFTAEEGDHFTLLNGAIRPPNLGLVHKEAENWPSKTIAEFVFLLKLSLTASSRPFEMGAGQSTSNSPDEKVFQNETPISFSPDVVNRLSDRLESPETTPERQSILDSHIVAKIRDELEHLKRDEEVVRQEIERALERENLDREKAMAGEASEGDGSTTGDVRNSAALLGDLEEVRAKIEKYQVNKKSAEYPEVEASGAAVSECYKKNKDTPLNCWPEVTRFKASVDKLEQVSTALLIRRRSGISDRTPAAIL